MHNKEYLDLKIQSSMSLLELSASLSGKHWEAPVCKLMLQGEGSQAADSGNLPVFLPACMNAMVLPIISAVGFMKEIKHFGDSSRITLGPQIPLPR